MLSLRASDSDALAAAISAAVTSKLGASQPSSSWD
jgi:hypothetical protein